VPLRAQYFKEYFTGTLKAREFVSDRSVFPQKQLYLYSQLWLHPEFGLISRQFLSLLNPVLKMVFLRCQTPSAVDATFSLAEKIHTVGLVGLSAPRCFSEQAGRQKMCGFVSVL